jgi:oxalate decarboxylase/phosphoglucose isomerase-like protein (cupin superfamily)
MDAYDVEKAPSAAPLPWDSRTPYEQWCDDQAVPIIKGFHIPDLTAIELGSWVEMGAQGAVLQIEGTEETNGAYILKVLGGESSRWQKHLFEELFYVVQGEGLTEVKTPTGSVTTCRWRTGSIFAVPLNFEYRHLATSDALFYCVTSAPMVMNLFHSYRFVFDNPFTEFGRFDGSEDYFSPEGTLWAREDGATIWETNLVEDARDMALPMLEQRGKGSTNLCFELGDGTVVAHISEFPSGNYKKAHRHGPGAHVVMLGGTGYTLLWQKSLADVMEIEWTENAIIVPPSNWFHQHFNVGDTPARYLALRWGSWKHRLNHQSDGVVTNQRSGGNQIEYEDEDPFIRERFDKRRAELRQAG